MVATSLVELGEVVYVEGSDQIQFADSADACRIKVRMDSDGKQKPLGELPYAFPLLPKTIQSVPKVGEGVFILNAKIGHSTSQRYYIGPIISQPQFQELCQYKGGEGDALSLLVGGKTLKEAPLGAISRAKAWTEGAFPKPNDVALIGRGQEDIVLKYRSSNQYGSETSEVDLRAGIRVKPADTTHKFIKGNVVFNNANPGYIQVKHATNGLAGLEDGIGDFDPAKYESPEIRTANSLVNVVADKINLISHKDVNGFGEKIKDREQLVLEEEIDNIMSQLHRSVYGDELITLLKLIVRALCEHTHPYSQLPPTIVGTTLEELPSFQYDKILSPNVRIS